MNSRDKQIIDKILDESLFCESITADYSIESFLSDEKTKRAICMTLINIGELSKSLTPDIKIASSQIPWKAISGMRDIAAHKYQTLNMGDVWVTATIDIPKLKHELQELLSHEK